MKHIKEIRTFHKEIFGEGTEHKIFESRRYSDRVYKVGPSELIKKWTDIFKSNPNIFPIIYKIDTLKGKNLEGFLNYFNVSYNEQYYYVLIEKLNTEDFIKFWKDLEYQLFYLVDDEDEDFEDLSDITYRFHQYRNLWYDLFKRVKKKKPNLYDKTLQLYKTIEELNYIVDEPDLHMFNFGFDSKGNIKCLDI